MNHEKEEPIWQPIERLELVASMIDGQLLDAQEQWVVIQEALQRPGCLDVETVLRILQVYNQSLQYCWVFEEQVSKWQKESSRTAAQKTELERLTGQIKLFRETLNHILGLAETAKAKSS